MRPLCLVLTSDYDKSKDTEKEYWKKEAEYDFAAVQETLGNTHDIIEIKVDVFSKDAKVEELIPHKLTDHILENINSCHIVINSHGSVAKKDLQDSAIKKVIERLSIFGIPISQMTALTCHAMSENSIAHRNQKLNAIGINTDYKNNNSLRQDTTIGILIKKISKMELPIVQKFKIIGPAFAYNAEEDKDLVKAMLTGQKINDDIKIETVTTRSPNNSIGNYLSSIQEAINWLHSLTENKAYDRSDKLIQQQYDKYTNLLGNLLTKLADKLEEKYKQGNEINFEIHDDTSMLQASLLNHLRENMKLDELNAKNFRKVYKDWKEKNKVSSEVRLDIFREYVSLNNQLISPPSSQENSPTQSPLTVTSFAKQLTPISLEHRFFKCIDKIDDEQPSEKLSENPKKQK